MTSGGQGGTNGGLATLSPRVRRMLLGAFVGMGAIRAAVNAGSAADEHARAGRPLDRWEPWAWELSSLAGWTVAVLLVAAMVARVRPPRFGWPATLALHAMATVPVSLVHVGVMAAIRHAVYAAQGAAYRFAENLPAALLYEYRKDAADYLLIAGLLVLAERVLVRPAPAAEPMVGVTLAAPLVEVRDGSRTTWLRPDEIGVVEAAGNYVELHTAAGAMLSRATLVSLEGELGQHGFVRVHRSRLVNLASVRELQTAASGDFTITLADGRTLAGSRRYRANVEARLAELRGAAGG